MSSTVEIGNFTVGTGQPLFLIAGPCVIESERHAFKMAARLAQLGRLDVAYNNAGIAHAYAGAVGLRTQFEVAPFAEQIRRALAGQLMMWGYTWGAGSPAGSTRGGFARDGRRPPRLTRQRPGGG